MTIKPEEVDIPEEVLDHYNEMVKSFRKSIMKRALNCCVLFEKDTMSVRELEAAHDYYCSEYAV